MSSISQVVYLVGSQVATKAVTFVSNQVLLRRISPEIFGIAAYLEFLVNSVLFFSREAVRITNQRANGESTITNFAYLPLFLCGPIFLALSYVQMYSDLYQNTVSQLPYFGAIFSLIAASIVLELAAEPLFAINQHNLNFKIRSKVESSAVFVKCVTVFGCVAWCQKQREILAHPQIFKGRAVLSFAIGQFVYSAVIFFGYWRSALGFPLIKKLQNNHYLDSELLSVWKSLFVQMVFKHLLTEGDTLLISYLFTVTQQGVYSVIANYGSMVARLLFQPIEESLRVSFTKSLSQKKPDYQNLYGTMGQLMTFYYNLSLLIIIGGYTNGAFLLSILLGRSEKWSQSSVFRDFPIYVLYIPFMAFNGILEAFFSSASSQRQIGRFSLFMSLSSVLVFALMYVFIGKFGWGIRGLILANMANMALRILYCLIFFVQFFKQHVEMKLGAVRKMVVPATLSMSALAIQSALFKNGMSASRWEFAQSILICVVCLGGMLVNEREQVMVLVTKIRKRGKQE